MLKAEERMHKRNKLSQIGPMCMGQTLISCYRTLKDDETGLSFCMIMRWTEHYNDIQFDVQATDELIHLWYEDNGRDFEREHYLEKNGGIELSEDIVNSPVYKRVYDQLLRNMKKMIEDEEKNNFNIYNE